MLIFMVANTLAMAARAWVRLALMKLYGWDDVVLVLAYVSASPPDQQPQSLCLLPKDFSPSLPFTSPASQSPPTFPSNYITDSGRVLTTMTSHSWVSSSAAPLASLPSTSALLPMVTTTIPTLIMRRWSRYVKSPCAPFSHCQTGADPLCSIVLRHEPICSVHLLWSDQDGCCPGLIPSCGWPQGSSYSRHRNHRHGSLDLYHHDLRHGPVRQHWFCQLHWSSCLCWHWVLPHDQ